MFNPTATYRIQFHKEFTFTDFEKIIPYLAGLEISTVYASPIFEAVPGSSHGYDVTNPHRINPEIGTLNQFRKIGRQLHGLGISWLQDIVPNHMAFHNRNGWLMDVLKNGQTSEYARFFDVYWDANGFNGKLMIPVLGERIEQVIKNNQLSIVCNSESFEFSYGGQFYPINAESYSLLPSLEKHVSPQGDLKSALKAINNDPDILKRILDQQYYSLSYWKDSDARINYRRFFTVNGLICLNMQNQEVFDQYHSFIKSLIDEGLIQGLRVDHIDGLFDPRQYLERLRRLAGEKVYIVVEKILEPGEQFPENWPVQGNTGYDFLAQVNNLLTANENKELFTTFYKDLVGKKTEAREAVIEKKEAILREFMGGELENLVQLFFDLRLEQGKNISKALRENLKTTIGKFLVHCPVYRYYANQFPLIGPEKQSVKAILNDIYSYDRSLVKAISLLEEVLFYRGKNKDLQKRSRQFYLRCMQFTGPLMAKGVEDTLMYSYDRFIGHNEVGDSPEAFGIEVATFHKQMVRRQQKFPLSLNATSTHDTKRGEDVRARLNVLTDKGEEWLKTVRKWVKLNEPLKEGSVPDKNDEYLIYQTLTGCHPLPGLNASELPERINEYLVKALREAKVHSAWAEPNESYETKTINFADQLLSGSGSFQKNFANFQNEIADVAVVNSLTQVLLKFTCPGIPDVYQGCELWDLSLVDPDNRRPVDYKSPSQKLTTNASPDSLWKDRYSGDIKLWLTNLLFKLRKGQPEVFSKGMYIPLRIKGKYKSNLIAFARKHAREWVIIVAPLHLAGSGQKINDFDWDNTKIVLPESAPISWDNLLSDESQFFSDQVPVKDLFTVLPFGLLKSSQQKSNRSAGVIMHITSLPSAFGTGDMGPEARKFADFLSNAGQSYWQVLPINPTSAMSAFSPYSTFSSMAGNTLLISPEDLLANGWLTTGDTDKHRLTIADKCDFRQASGVRRRLFKIAFSNFHKRADNKQQSEYVRFKETEAYWLNEFALYEALKSQNKHKPWYEWPDRFKFREAKAIKACSSELSEEIELSKWLQYIFLKQWTALKTYAGDLGIKIIGDLAFYVSYDSVDVWSNPRLFKLDKKLRMDAVAGVPPDYFSETGQLWNMPVYDWKAHKDTRYQWWVNRLKKNLQFFDVVRLDHFRAFCEFWQVPATERTAVNGSWQPGPGEELFKAFDSQLKSLPFVAEDLGDISPDVYKLRDKLGLPGMNVLQYGFGNDMPVSVHASHNHLNHSVTYTGTHDNNTITGWFHTDADKDTRSNIESYTRAKINETNIHEVMLDLCYRSSAETAIVPLQDLLGLDETNRMNTPSAGKNNWLWRLEEGQLKTTHGLLLNKLAKKYNR